MTSPVAPTSRTRKPAFTEADAASLLGCSIKAFRLRMVALGLVQVCTRCCGSGKYSYNQTDGDRCYGCNGRGKSLLPVTRALAEDMKRRQDAGELASYFAACEARAAAKRRIAPLVAEAVALYDPIGAAYMAYGRDRDAAEVVASPMYRAQTMANAIRWGGRGSGGRMPTGLALMGVADIEWEVQQGRCVDYERAAAELAERVEMLRTLRAAWETFQ